MHLTPQEMEKKYGIQIEEASYNLYGCQTMWVDIELSISLTLLIKLFEGSQDGRLSN